MGNSANPGIGKRFPNNVTKNPQTCKEILQKWETMTRSRERGERGKYNRRKIL